MKSVNNKNSTFSKKNKTKKGGVNRSTKSRRNKIIKLKNNLTQKISSNGGGRLSNFTNRMRGKTPQVAEAVPGEAIVEQGEEVPKKPGVLRRSVAAIGDAASKTANVMGKAANAANSAASAVANSSLGKGLFSMAKLATEKTKTSNSSGSGLVQGASAGPGASYAAAFNGGTLPDDLQRKMYESICSNMNNLFIQNSNKFESTVNSAIQSLFDTDVVKEKFKLVLFEAIDSFAKDPEISAQMNDKIEGKILDSVANHIQSKLAGSDVSISADEIKKIIGNYPAIMRQINNPVAPPPMAEEIPMVEEPPMENAPPPGAQP